MEGVIVTIKVSNSEVSTDIIGDCSIPSLSILVAELELVKAKICRDIENYRAKKEDA